MSPSLLGSLEQLVLLAVLRLGEEAYSMGVIRELETEASFRISRGALYTTLDRLEKKGLLQSRLGDPLPERGGRARRYFTVTVRGKAELKVARDALASLWAGVESSALER